MDNSLFVSGTPIQPQPIRRFWWWTVAIAVLALICLPFDISAAQMLQVENLPGDARRILKLSEFFGHGYIVLVCIAAIWTLAPDKRRFIPRVALCALLPGVYAQGVKILVSRDRPIGFGQLPETFASTWHGILPAGEFNMDYATQAFMSAHTATAIGLALGLSWLFPRGRWLFLTLACLAATQRIAFEAHWLSDVVAGAAVGVMTAGALTQNWGFGYVCGRIERPRLETATNDDTSNDDTSNDDTSNEDARPRIAA